MLEKRPFRAHRCSKIKIAIFSVLKGRQLQENGIKKGNRAKSSVVFFVFSGGFYPVNLYNRYRIRFAIKQIGNKEYLNMSCSDLIIF